MGEDPRAIRTEIDETREQMGDTVEALAYKSDVKSRAKESVSDKMTNVKEKVVGAGDTIGERTPDTEQVKHGARQAVGVAQENPLGLAIGSLAVGFVAGMMIPSTRIEDQKLGPVADQVKDRAQETGQAALEHGKQVTQDVAQTAKETAKESGQEHAQQVKGEAQESAQQGRESMSPQSMRGRSS
jgi:gas vesicle protein